MIAKQIIAHLNIIKQDIHRLEIELLALNSNKNIPINESKDSLVNITIDIIRRNGGSINQTQLLEIFMNLKKQNHWDLGYNRSCKFLKQLEDSKTLVISKGNYNATIYSFPKQPDQTTETKSPNYINNRAQTTLTTIGHED